MIHPRSHGDEGDGQAFRATDVVAYHVKKGEERSVASENGDQLKLHGLKKFGLVKKTEFKVVETRLLAVNMGPQIDYIFIRAASTLITWYTEKNAEKLTVEYAARSFGGPHSDCSAKHPIKAPRRQSVSHQSHQSPGLLIETGDDS